jgi:rfaE bifunctional protein kinase chain/domain
MFMVRPRRVEEIIAAFPDKRVLVIGDVILDRYVFGAVDRISPEAPVPVVKVSREENRLGGAGNVAANIDRLGAHGLLVGLVGNDAEADCVSSGKPLDCHLVRSSACATIVKTRVVAQRQQVVRIDREDALRPTAEDERRLIDTMQQLRFDGAVVSDYAKGTLNRPLMDALKEKCLADHVPLVVDPKPSHASLYGQVTGITPNLREAEALLGRSLGDDDSLQQGLLRLRRQYRSRFVVITRGDRGISAAESGRRSFHLPAYSHEVFDVTGAGDTVAAVLTLALTSGADLREALYLANAAASLVVEKIGTWQVSPDELRERSREIRHRH